YTHAEKMTTKRYIYERRVLKRMHEDEPWFHARINRQEAEYRLKRAGAKNGLFLVRARAENASKDAFTLSLCYKLDVTHYMIREAPDGKLDIPAIHVIASSLTDKGEFGSLVQLVDYYHRFEQGLLCNLRHFCSRLGGSVLISHNFLIHSELYDSTDTDESPEPAVPSPTLTIPSPNNITSAFKFDLSGFMIDPNSLLIGNKLGGGQFGEVFEAIVKVTNQRVAVKSLKNPSEQIHELFTEGKLLIDLEHRYIVRIFGIYMMHPNALSLVLELCPFGAMNDYLRKNKALKMSYILNYMYQVSEGMSYLHEKNIIHRALRNVLIASDSLCKISDFGLSKRVEGHNYYQMINHRQLPFKWYPPEVLKNPKFHSEIDIWSYGVTLWEATSYGATPYKEVRELKSFDDHAIEPVLQKVLKFLLSGRRLPQPAACPNNVYRLMLKCWELDKQARPTFSKIMKYLRHYSFDFNQTSQNSTTTPLPNHNAVTKSVQY
ncbi:unnamed protein product, partial [Didymodactylos carnosus]